MKKKFYIFTLAILICGISILSTGCNTPSVDLYSYGIQMTTLMGNIINNEEYMSMLDFRNSEYSDFLANDYDTPRKTYTIEIPSNAQLIEKAMAKNEEYKKKFYNLPEEIQEQIQFKYSFEDSVLPFIIFKENISTNKVLSITSKTSAKREFEGSITSPKAYLFTFETGTPIIVLFRNLNNKIEATSYFLPSKNFSNLSTTRGIFEEYGCTINYYNPNN